jgi:hypothetical protein
MSTQGLINPVGGIHVGPAFENNEESIAGTISSETAAFLVVLAGLVAAFVAAF